MRNIAFWVAAVLAFFLFPQEMDTGGLFTEIAILIGLVVVATPVLVYFAIVQNLPEEVDVAGGSDRQTTPQMRNLIREYESLGFEQAGVPVRFRLSTEALLVPLVNVREQMCATVYKLEGKEIKIAHDVVSCLDAPNCSLTTGQDVGAGVLPADPITMRQIFPGEGPTALVRHHQSALRFLSARGLPALDIAPSAIVELIKLSFRINRQCFMKAKVTNTFRALWRTISKRNPHLGALMQQGGIDELLRKIPRPRARRRSMAQV